MLLPLLSSFSALALVDGQQKEHPRCWFVGGDVLTFVWSYKTRKYTSYSSSCHHHSQHPELQ